MIALLLLLQAAELPAMPTDWSALAPIPYLAPPKVTPELSGFVATEITAGRCAMPKPTDGHYVVRVDVATLIAPDGTVRRAVPHAIACPTVEQYAAGLVTGFARGNLPMRPGATDAWYRATIVFEWNA